MNAYCRDRNHRHPVDDAIIMMTLCVIVLLAIFPVRNNDIWWHMAVGKQILHTGAFITGDPFSFTLAGQPWTPQSYLAGILFYLVYAAGSAPGLIALRALLVLGIFLMIVRILARAGCNLALAAPVLLLAAFSVHTRFIVRPHLFEYLFIAVLLLHLLRPVRRRGPVWYLLPVGLQILWVNMHPSFFLGPVIVLLFFSGEGIVHALSPRLRFFASPVAREFEWKPLLILLLLMVAACFVNPEPVRFITQPLGGEQRELITRYTLEWRSPFDPALRTAAFHPYFEILLALAAVCFIAGLRRLHLASLLLTGAFAALALQAHRFRFEFAVVAAPLMLMQLADSPLGDRTIGALSGAGRKALFSRVLIALVACGALIWTGRASFAIGGSVIHRYPHRALQFLLSEDIGHRPFHTIGFGSYMIWDLYPERKTFIDGRNYSADLHREFLLCQTDREGFDTVTAKYTLDSFVIPAPEECDPGMLNLHRLLIDSPRWRLVYCDRIAFIFVAASKVPPAWLASHEFRLYHPLTFGPARVTGSDAAPLVAELERATVIDPGYYRPWVDLGIALMRLDRAVDAMNALERAVELVPGNYSILHNYGVAAARAGRWDQAANAFERELALAPLRVETHLALARVYMQLNRIVDAESEAAGALRLDPQNRNAKTLLEELRARRR